MRIGLLLSLLLSLSQFTYSQATTDSQLAAHYYQSGDFPKAAMYYKRLYNSDHSTFHYNYYLKCLFETEDFKSAESLVKFHKRLVPNDHKVKVDLGVVYEKQGKEKQANKEYDRLIQKVIANYSSVHDLALAFANIKKFDLALKTYQRGESIMKGRYPFNVEKAEIYAQQKEYESMVDELLGLLDLSPGYIGVVQTSLSKYLTFETGTEQNQILKSRLIKKINQKPNETMYSELLLWLYQQEGNWKGALLQTKSLDRRKKADGQLVYMLGETLINNEQYDLCVEACTYVIDQGEEKPFYIEAKILALECRHRKITQTSSYTDEDIQSLLNDYNSTLDELGRNVSTVGLLKEKAVIQSFYQHELDSGLNTFEEALQIPGVDEVTRAEIKLDYGDALVAGGFVWDAALAYGQVDKQFKYDRLGEIAKLKSAQVKFYTGNFSLAKAQLDVLKGSTSKLIANDAMQLSILITDNSTIDTTTKPLKLYADASLLIVQNKPIDAREKLDSINKYYPGHALEDDIFFLRYEMAFKEKAYEEAAGYLETIVAGYSYDILADKSLYYLAELNEFHLNDPDKAKDLYQAILLDYQDSLYATEARKRFRRLRGDQIN